MNIRDLFILFHFSDLSRQRFIFFCALHGCGNVISCALRVKLSSCSLFSLLFYNKALAITPNINHIHRRNELSEQMKKKVEKNAKILQFLQKYDVIAMCCCKLTFHSFLLRFLCNFLCKHRLWCNDE